MRDFSKLSDNDLLYMFNNIMAFNIGDVGKSVKELTDSYPNAFWRLYREIEHRDIYRKRDSSKFVGIIGSRRRDEKEDFDFHTGSILKLLGIKGTFKTAQAIIGSELKKLLRQNSA